MLNQPAMTGSAPPGASANKTIRSRFGDITVDPRKAVTFPRGLLGMADKFNFVLANFPSPKMQQFTLLQSLDDHALSFITLPVSMENAIITRKDLLAACQDLQILEANLAVLLIVTVHRSPGQVRLSVNSRAPLLIDAERKLGVQYVFTSDIYKVQHMLS